MIKKIVVHQQFLYQVLCAKKILTFSIASTKLLNNTTNDKRY